MTGIWCEPVMATCGAWLHRQARATCPAGLFAWARRLQRSQGLIAERLTPPLLDRWNELSIGCEVRGFVDPHRFPIVTRAFGGDTRQ